MGCSSSRAAMVGTAPQRCTCSDSMSASTCPGSKRPVLKTIRPPVRTWVIRVANAPMWNNGVETRFTACIPSAGINCGSWRERARTFCWFATIDRNGSTTAFGMPVLPEVNRMTAGCSSSAGPGMFGTVAVPASKQSPREAMSITGGPSGNSPVASVMTARGATTVRQCAASEPLHHRLPSTGTAPAAQVAHSASTHSGLLYATSKTRSPGPIPLTASRFRAESTAPKNSPKAMRRSLCTRNGRGAQRSTPISRSVNDVGRSR